MEIYGDKSDVDQGLLKTFASKLQLLFGELIKCFQVTEQITRHPTFLCDTLKLAIKVK